MSGSKELDKNSTSTRLAINNLDLKCELDQISTLKGKNQCLKNENRIVGFDTNSTLLGALPKNEDRICRL